MTAAATVLTSASVVPQCFGEALKQWRQQRRLSQLQLALDADVSQRHISFLESGRSSPSRGMVMQLADCLGVPLRDRNQLLQVAGFSQAFGQRDLSEVDMAPLRNALNQQLEHHDPYPAVVMDRHWNVLQMNDSMAMVFALAGDINDVHEAVGNIDKNNLLRLTFHPQGIRQYMQNWEKVGGILLARIQQEARHADDPELTALLAEIESYPGMPKPWQQPNSNATQPPVVSMDLLIGEQPLSLFSMIATFGTALDVTADELRLELFYPNDEPSKLFLNELAGD